MKNILKTLSLSAALMVSANAGGNPYKYGVRSQLAQSSVHTPAIGTNEMPQHFIDAGVTQESFDTFIETLYALRDQTLDGSDDNAKSWLTSCADNLKPDFIDNEVFMRLIVSRANQFATKNIAHFAVSLNTVYVSNPQYFSDLTNTLLAPTQIIEHESTVSIVNIPLN